MHLFGSGYVLIMLCDDCGLRARDLLSEMLSAPGFVNSSPFNVPS